jgi:hypothetical protein
LGQQHYKQRRGTPSKPYFLNNKLKSPFDDVVRWRVILAQQAALIFIKVLDGSDDGEEDVRSIA